MVEPYFADEHVRLYHGDMREVVQDLTDYADAVITDPPYGETSLEWDRWVDGWPLLMTWHTNSMWCFGSMRMFTENWGQFCKWHLAQDVIWDKGRGSGLRSDRFKRTHELVLHFTRGPWAAIYHEPRAKTSSEQRR